MDVILLGGLVRALQALASATPTILIGLFIAAILRYYLGNCGNSATIRRREPAFVAAELVAGYAAAGMFDRCASNTSRDEARWCTCGFHYRLRSRRSSIQSTFIAVRSNAFASGGDHWIRPSVAVCRHRCLECSGIATESTPYCHLRSLRLGRLVWGDCWPVAIFMMRETLGTTGLLSLVAVSGTLVLGAILPHGALQTAVEQKDPWAPAVMTAVAIPIYATPMLSMSQLGMMFAHGNSPGAAFSLLLLGTGVNVATLLWIAWNYGWKSSFIWFAILTTIVLGCAYAIDRPLIPPGIEPAGHTHAFDIYTNPFHSGTRVSASQFKETLLKSVGIGEWASIFVLTILALGGVVLRWVPQSRIDKILCASTIEKPRTGRGDIIVSPRVVGMTCIAGLIALSVVGCYAYYPSPNETLEEMRIARAEALGSANAREKKRSLEWIPIWDEWSRKLEVGYAIRHFELRPYQQAQAKLLRKKLELLEHELEHDPLEIDELRKVVTEVNRTSQRLTAAFREKETK